MGNAEQQAIHSSLDPGWRTEQALFDALHREAHFWIDLAADAENCKVQDEQGLYYYGPDHPDPDSRNALTIEWHTRLPGGVGFLNMPYSKKALSATQDPSYDVAAWVAKAYLESVLGFTTWALVPFSPQTGWYRRYVMGHTEEGGGFTWGGHAAMEVRRLAHRVDFDPSPETLARVQAEYAAGTRKSEEVSSAGHNVVVVIWKPNPGYLGPWVPTERYWGYR